MIKRFLLCIVRSILGQSYMAVRLRFLYLKGKYLKHSFAVGNLENEIARILNWSNGYYVEIGANDGVNQSNTLNLELKRGWRGLLVEPMPHNYATLVAYRGERNAVVCAACVSGDYDSSEIKLRYFNLMSYCPSQVNEFFDPNLHENSGFRFLENHEVPYTVTVPARTLSDLLDAAEAPSLIDFFSLDVEGAELSVLRGINFIKYKFKYILVESGNITPIEEFLSDYLYKMVGRITHHDYLFQYCDGLSAVKH